MRDARGASIAARGGLPAARPAAILRRTLEFRHIAIEGPIGVGKSALAERLASAPRRHAGPRRRGQSVPRRFLRRASRRGACRRSSSSCSAAIGSSARCGKPISSARSRSATTSSSKDKIYALPESRRQRALHLPAALRPARAGRPVARPRDLPADADRRPAAPAADRAAPSPSVEALSPDEQYLQELNEAYHHFFFHYTASRCWWSKPRSSIPPADDEAIDDLIRQIADDGPAARSTTCPRTGRQE